MVRSRVLLVTLTLVAGAASACTGDDGDQASCEPDDGITTVDDPVDGDCIDHDEVLDFELAGLNGTDDTRLGDLTDDRPLVLNFFAVTCAPCLEEMPDFEAVHQDLAEDVSIVGLSVDMQPDHGVSVVEQTGVTYPTYFDDDGSAMTLFRAVGLPTTVFISPEGRVREVFTGQLSQDELRGKLADHFEVGTTS